MFVILMYRALRECDVKSLLLPSSYPKLGVLSPSHILTHTHTHTEIQAFQGHQVYHKGRKVPGSLIDKRRVHWLSIASVIIVIRVLYIMSFCVI